MSIESCWRLLILAVFACVACGWPPSVSHAAPILVPDADGVGVLDTATMLEWLPISSGY